MDKFIEKHKGPLIAIGSAVGGLLLLLIILALANMPAEMSLINILTNLIWLILIGLLCVGVLLYIKENYFSKTEDDLYDQIPRQPTLYQPNRAPQIVGPGHDLIKGEMLKLFGTTDMKQITAGIQAMYDELSEWREEGGVEPANNKAMISKLTSELEKAQEVSARWEAKAISSTQEVERLRQEIKEHGKWRPVNSEQLEAFLPTVTIKDGNSLNAFLESKRRQRRLVQRMSAEGYSIVCRVE